jgi:hypothetical protein
MSFLPSPVFAQADDGIFGFLHTMKGPDFLGLYFVWFAVIFVTVLIFVGAGTTRPS